MNVVVVESPAKARTINKYLGSDYRVIASLGHVRDLPAKDGSVDPERAFEMIWEVDAKAQKPLKEISAALKGASKLYLATDPDREGEAISWHVLQELKRRKLLDGVSVERIVFTEITREAVLEAIANPRALDENLIDAYRARRALDYLVGFTLSPVLWRKLPGSRSAGRVQSVALRLVCEREAEIEVFEPREYWTVEADFRTSARKPFTARLTHLKGAKLGKFDLDGQARAEAAKSEIEARTFRVAAVETKRIKRHPPPPFTTSTLQQEASRKLGFRAKRTMQVAQRLYEGIDLDGETVGLISYMRTDGVQMASSARDACRKLIGRAFGPDYLPEKHRIYKTVAKNAQEAHGAIRPTDPARRPEDIGRFLEDDQRRLYELIWKRTLASQMANAELDQAGVEIVSPDEAVRLKATGTVIAFDGFFRLYREGGDEPETEGKDDDRLLPAVSRGEDLGLEEVRPDQHFTQPPARYTEASLVKRLEELGIGRPSTYASILSVLQERNYVRMEKRHFLPEDRGRLVTAFLVSFFQRYVEYDFTARLEEELDEISAGTNDWKGVLQNFWVPFRAAVSETEGLKVRDLLVAIEKLLAPHIFPADPQGGDARLCPRCGSGQLALKLGRYGPFVGCSDYPDCRYTRELVTDGRERADASGPRELGTDPATGLEVSLRKGPYGFYLQLGEAQGDGERPKRVSLPKSSSPDSLDLDGALGLLSLPREIGTHPETGEPITAGIGRFGPYISHSGVSRSLGPDDEALTIGLNRAVALLASPSPGRGGTSELIRELGPHPHDRRPVSLRKGRYGPYVRHGGKNARIPRNLSAETITLEEAVALVDAKAKTKKSKTRGGARTRKAKGAAPRRAGGGKAKDRAGPPDEDRTSET